MNLLRGKHTSLLLVAVVCLCVSGASAARLDLSHPHYPLVASGSIDVSYDPGGGSGSAGRLTAAGFTGSLQTSQTSSQSIYGYFNLTVDIDTSTGAGLSGTLQVGDEFMTGNQLFGSLTLTEFGWGTLAGDDVIEFAFTQSGNMLADNGDNVGVILAVGRQSAPWDFTQSFDTLIGGSQYTGNGVSETF